MVTPGGHRRFSEADVDRFAAQGERSHTPDISHQSIYVQVHRLPGLLSQQVFGLGARLDAGECVLLKDLALVLLARAWTAVELGTPVDEVRDASHTASRDVAEVALGRFGMATAVEATLAVKQAALATAAALPELARMTKDMRDRVEACFSASAEGVQLALCDAAGHNGNTEYRPVDRSTSTSSWTPTPSC